MTMSPHHIRGPFTGVRHIVQFNWPFYGAACVTILGLVMFAWLAPVPRLFAIAALLAAVGAVWLIGSSLVASYWIYDRSPLSRWEWLREFVPSSSERLVNVHAGFDESSPALRRLFPQAEVLELDFYDVEKASEPSIARARKLYPPSPNVQSIHPACWPVADGSCVAVFLLLAAHELRRSDDRVAFFQEARRALKPGGQVILVEHLRDFPNFLAFGPGFLHFLPRQAWLQATRESGLAIRRELSITPFVRVFILAPQCS